MIVICNKLPFKVSVILIYNCFLQAEIDDLRQPQVAAEPRSSRKERKVNSKARKLANSANQGKEQTVNIRFR